ncbi:MAG: tetratricopeptide repeat protein [Calditrichia bacterium]
MRLYALLVSLFLIAPPVHAQSHVNSKEKTLAGLSGEQKVPLLAELVEDYQTRIPHNAIAYGREALVLLSQFPENETEIEVVIGISKAYLRLGKHFDALVFAERGKLLAEQAANHTTLAATFLQISIIQRKMGNLDHALAAGLQSERISGDSLDCENNLNLGIIYRKLGSYQESLDYFYKALECQKKRSDLLAEADVYAEIGLIYQQINDNSRALTHLTSALNITKKLGDSVRTGRFLNNIGSLYQSMQEYSKALEFHFKAYKTREALDDMEGVAESANHIGKNYLLKNRYGLAMDYFASAMENSSQLNNKELGIRIQLNTAVANGKLRQNVIAMRLGKDALWKSREAGNTELVIASLETLALLCEERRDYQGALVYQRQVKIAEDSVMQRKVSNRIATFNSIFQKEKEVALLQKDAELKQAILTRQQTWTYALLGIVITCGIIAGLLLSRYRIRKKAHNELKRAFKELEAANKELKVVNRHMIRQSSELHEAMSKIKRLSGFLPICSTCKDVRTDTGYWQRIERYINENSDAEFSKSICPRCAKGKIHALPLQRS